MNFSPIIKRIILDLAAKKTYLKKGQAPPKGKVVKRGPKNGHYYDEEVAEGVAKILNQYENSPYFIQKEIVVKGNHILESFKYQQEKVQAAYNKAVESGDAKEIAIQKKYLENVTNNIAVMMQSVRDGEEAVIIAKRIRGME